MKYQNLLLKLVLAGAVLGFQVEGQASLQSILTMVSPPISSSEPSSPPEKEIPLRFAKGKVHIFRTILKFNEKTGQAEQERTSVCTEAKDVAVYDFRGATKGRSIALDPIECNDEVEGRAVKIQTWSIVALHEGQYLGIDQPLKSFANGAWINKKVGPQLPEVPNQHTFSTDLDQIFFGTNSSANQYIICKTPKGLQRFEPGTTTPQKDCEIVNPITYQVQWTVEDSQK